MEDHRQLTIYDLNNNKNKDEVNIINQSKFSYRSELYEEEIKQAFTHLNNLITKFSIDKDRLKNSKLISQNKISELKENMKIIHVILNQLKSLINIENSRLSTKGKTVNKKHKLKELENKINWMKKSLHLATVRYNEIGKFLGLPEKDLYLEITEQTIPFQLNYISRKRRQEIDRLLKFKETELIITDLRTSVELLKTRIVDHGITPTYRLLKRNTSGQRSVFEYSCSLFGLYVEGSGNSKYEAKENTAAEMVRLILKRQKTLTLSSHIRAFNENELNTMSPLIKFKTNYVKSLENACVKNKYPPPIYTILSHTKNYAQLEEHYSIQCEAMDFVAIGHSNKRTAAKQLSAQNILNLWEKMNSKNMPSEKF